MFFRKKQPANDPRNPQWIKWMVLAFFIFAVLSNLHKKPGDSPVIQALDKARSDTGKIINFADYKNKIFPSYDAQMRVRDTQAGKGNPAVCGQEVKIAYQAFLTDNKPLDGAATKDKPLVFRIGENKVLPALEQGVAGMQPGGKRSILSPASMAYGAPGYTRPDVPADAPVRFEMELLDASPTLPDMKISPYRVATTGSGLAPVMRCGEKATVKVMIWSIDGKKLYPAQDAPDNPITFTPGQSEVFLGLEQGVLGLGRGGTRTLIVPPSFQKTLNGNTPAIDFPFPKDQTVLVDIEAMP